MLFTKEFAHEALYFWNYETRDAEEKYWKKYYTFTDRDSYLMWVSNWKKLYKDISIAIRYLKMERRTVRPKASWYIQEIANQYRSTYGGKGASYTYEADVMSLARIAYTLLRLRENAKKLSQKMKAEMRAKETVTPLTRAS